MIYIETGRIAHCGRIFRVFQILFFHEKRPQVALDPDPVAFEGCHEATMWKAVHPICQLTAPLPAVYEYHQLPVTPFCLAIVNKQHGT